MIYSHYISLLWKLGAFAHSNLAPHVKTMTLSPLL